MYQHVYQQVFCCFYAEKSLILRLFFAVMCVRFHSNNTSNRQQKCITDNYNPIAAARKNALARHSAYLLGWLLLADVTARTNNGTPLALAHLTMLAKPHS